MEELYFKYPKCGHKGDASHPHTLYERRATDEEIKAEGFPGASYVSATWVECGKCQNKAPSFVIDPQGRVDKSVCHLFRDTDDKPFWWNEWIEKLSRPISKPLLIDSWNVVCDETNNTPEDIKQNALNVHVELNMVRKN